MANVINATSTGSGGLVSTGDDSGILNIQTNETTAITVDASQKVSFTNPIQGGSITSGTSVASTSGTSIDFTSIPSWVKRITVVFNEVSTNGTSGTVIQIGTSGGVVTSGYVSSSVGVSSGGVGVNSITNGFGIRNDNASYVFSGHMVITLLGSNIWISSHTGKISTSIGGFGGGSVTLGGTLDRIRITTVNGTDTYDAGSINILYEG